MPAWTPVAAGAGQWPMRITLTPAGLAPVKKRLLLIRGQDKRALLQTRPGRQRCAGTAHPPGHRRTRHALRVHWCLEAGIGDGDWGFATAKTLVAICTSDSQS